MVHFFVCVFVCVNTIAFFIKYAMGSTDLSVTFFPMSVKKMSNEKKKVYPG